MRESISAAEARRVALAAQGLARAARPANPGTRQLNATMARLGAAQIDSVNVFARAHYMPFFSRLGPYDPAALDRLVFATHGPYVEYAAHETAFIPIEDWALWRFRMDALRAKYAAEGSWFDHNAVTVAWVRAELASRGPLRPAQIETDAHRGAKGPWWDWSAVKHALELLWLFGDVAIAGRRGFERRYALTADVIPTAVLARPVPRSEAIRELVGRAARALGVATSADLADYYRLRDRSAVAAAIGELTDAGELAPVRRRRRPPQPVRPAGVVPRARGATVRLRVPHRDLHPGAAAPVRVLLAPGPRGRPDRCPRGPEGGPGVLDTGRAVGVVGAGRSG